MRRGIAVLVAVAALALVPLPAAAARFDMPGLELERVIVVLHERAGDALAVAREHARIPLARVGFVYEHALRGYAAELPARAVDAIARDPRVAYIETDQRVQAFELPTGVDRIEADRNPKAAINGVDTRVDVDVAIIDTGIAAHPDLNIVGGTRCAGLLLGLLVSCSTGGLFGRTFADDNGHGTHVAGTVGAIDNGSGVVGVAPGARLWAVKVLDSFGAGFISEIVAGIDWVTARADTIEVANMSLGCQCTSQALDDALTRSTNAGIVYAAAAGNNAVDAALFSPANHPQVIAVSAMADFDGRPGGLADATCRADEDDTRADFSNFGSVVDLAAPGVCIRSTWLDGGFETISGTSMASPHAAGAAALYVVAHEVPRGSQRWQAVRNGLRANWSVPQSHPCGFDGGLSDEPMLIVGGPCLAP